MRLHCEGREVHEGLRAGTHFGQARRRALCALRGEKCAGLFCCGTSATLTTVNFPLLLPLLAFAAAAHAADMFPFQLPWDDATESATNVSWLNDKPAGAAGFVHVKDGHLFAGGKRLRIFGVNTCFAANFPDKAMAPKVAARMAKFGINCVRFHHMDMLSAPAGIFAQDGRTLDPGQLDRLDFFIAELKKNGIYADLNLHVSRTYPDRTRAEKKGNPDYDKGVDNFCAAMIALQKDYARDLLTHVNPYTGHRYADEPAVALVEINNENALGFQWWAGQMDDLPAPYLIELESLWTEWITKKHGDDEAARKAWRVGERVEGEDLLHHAKEDAHASGSAGGPPAVPGVSPGTSNVTPPAQRDTSSPGGRTSTPSASRGTRDAAGGTPALPDANRPKNAWNFEQHGDAVAKHTEKDGIITVDVEKSGTESWHVQFSATPLAVQAGTYEVRFRVRSAKETTLTVALQQSHEPWKILGSANVKAGADWREVSATIKATEADANARLTIGGMGTVTGTFEFRGFSLRTAGMDGSLAREGARIPIIRKRDLARTTPAKQRDWQEFIWDTETAYWNGLRDFLKKDLGVKAPIVGTQGFWSPGHVQAGMDVIDSHAYWHHPDFHGRGWNADVWSVKNEPMAGAPDGGTLPGLAAQRVAGKPFLCTEYNHPAPNTHSAETFPLLCSFAALQDWDGVFAFSYSHRGPGEWAQETFNNFFDIDRHPVKMATLPAAVISFRMGNGGIASERYEFRTSYRLTLLEALEKGPRNSDGFTGASALKAFDYRVAYSDKLIDMDDGPAPAPAEPPQGRAPKNASPKPVRAPTAVSWAPNWHAVRMHTPRSGTFVGPKLEGDQPARLGALTLLTAGTTRQNWACYQITVLDRDERADFSTAKRILITATGDIENTGMGWKDAAKTSVGRDWGKAPVLVEGPAAKIELPGGGKFKAWALDERGQRRAEIPVAMDRGIATLEIGPQWKTLWYEVVRE